MSTTTTIFTTIGESPHSPQLEFFFKKNALISWLLNICLWNFQSVVYIKKKDASLQQLVQAWVIFIN
jgi:hypothetical protein